MKTCPQCGGTYRDDGLFCDCGYDFTLAKTIAARKKSRKYIIHGAWWLLGGLVFGGLGMTVLSDIGWMFLLTWGAVGVGLFQLMLRVFQAIYWGSSAHVSHHKLEEFLCHLKLLK